ncbi:DNA-binding protein [Loktanella sp. D2R18]|uniref:helix-turn-helix domain-containing protein n=1 Tax=Rhodobacterales TaxID=204455 RepID=UPI000DEB74AC|nr:MULTISPECIES: helix-turn-helix domain-containing protein [Rhodobacterales]RBW41233.1 DNA-binding protein [Loktanella sp. D2R18]
MVLDLELHDDIRYRLKKRGVTLSQISRELKKSPSTVTAVCQGRVKWDLIQRAICKHLGKKHPAEIWPDRYPEFQSEQEDTEMSSPQ